MTILGDLREFLAGNGRSGDSPDASADAPVEQAKDAAAPFAGYEQLNARDAMDQLADHSQEELEAVEGYERANKNRASVLNKLRYMRGNEPLSGYDTLDAAAITEALEDADMATIKRVRTYERKFAGRRDVLESVDRVFHERLKTEPARVTPAFDAVPISAMKDRGPDTKKD